MSEQCSNCIRLQAENTKLKIIIASLMAKLKATSRYCRAVNDEAGIILSEHQPRGTWSLFDGKAKVARKVLEIIRKS